MKRLFFIIFASIVIFSACSKKNNVQPANTITINGSIYNTVVIGNQTWTSINYNGPGGVNYNNSSVNNPAYGKLYTFIEAEAIVLPKGWRLPINEDFTNLIINSGAILITAGAPEGDGFYEIADTSVLKLLSKTTWNSEGGTNSKGFDAVAAGEYSTFNGYYAFQGIGTTTQFLTSSEFQDGSHECLQILQFNPRSTMGYLNNLVPFPLGRGSVRFVKDN